MKRLRIRVFGEVQGVFYRHYAQEKAVELGVKGWIRNDPDGSVFIAAEGDDGAVEEFLEWTKQGTPTSTVTNVDFTEEDYIGDSETFEIR